MTKDQIDSILTGFGTIAPGYKPLLEETHISWVLLCGDYVYKIKKPLHLHFLDFSTPEKRKFYCERELALNRRLTDDIYLDVLPVVKHADGIFIGRRQGEIIDHAVCMRRMESGRRMDILLKAVKVTTAQIDALAEKIAAFHRSARVIPDKDPGDIPEKFADLISEERFLQENLDLEDPACISRAIRLSDAFCQKHTGRLKERTRSGYVRDCHGDLHAKNIFLLSTPQPFDCIEFNDELREIDVLNEIAFLCMDLDAAGRSDLSSRFLWSYHAVFPVMECEEDGQLLLYFKAYRANIRAKINSLAARSAANTEDKTAALAESEKYLALMNTYLQKLK